MDSNSNSSFEFNLPPIVIPLKRVQIESDQEAEHETFNIFDHFSEPSTSAADYHSGVVQTTELFELDLINKSRICPICKAPAFSSVFFVASHILCHYDIKLYACADCNQRFSSNSLLVIHRRKVHNATKTEGRIVIRGNPEAQRLSRTCTTCDKLFQDRIRLSLHMLKRHAADLNQLQIADHRRRSLIKKRAQKDIGCPMCHVQFLNIPQLARHLIRKHRQNVIKHYLSRWTPKLKPAPKRSPRNFVCEFESCEKKFWTENRLKLHFKQKHNRIEMHNASASWFLCPICESKTPFGCRLLKEMSQHLIDQHSSMISEKKINSNGDSPALSVNQSDGCPFCDTKFAKSGISRHIFGHFNVRLFKCEICDDRFYSADLLRGHKTLSDKYQSALQAAEKQVIQIVHAAVERNFYCPYKKENLKTAAPWKTEEAADRLKCDQLVPEPDSNIAHIPFRVNDRFVKIKFAFRMKNWKAEPTHVKLERMSCPLCSFYYPIEKLRQHLLRTFSTQPIAQLNYKLIDEKRVLHLPLNVCKPPVTSRHSHVPSRHSHVTSCHSHVPSRHSHVPSCHSPIASRHPHVASRHSSQTFATASRSMGEPSLSSSSKSNFFTRFGVRRAVDSFKVRARVREPTRPLPMHNSVRPLHNPVPVLPRPVQPPDRMPPVHVARPLRTMSGTPHVHVAAPFKSVHESLSVPVRLSSPNQRTQFRLVDNPVGRDANVVSAYRTSDGRLVYKIRQKH